MDAHGPQRPVNISASHMLTHRLCFIHSQNHHPVAKLLISQPERYDVTTGMLVLVSTMYCQPPFVMTGYFLP